jgi:hypothetical protein
MSSDTFGALTGLAGFFLAAFGVLLALFAGLRMLWVIRRPGKGRIARGIAVGGLVLALCGALLFTVEEVGDSIRGTSDKLVHYLAALSALVAVLAGVRAARRRPAPKPVEPEATDDAAPAPQATPPAEPPEAESRGA